MQFLTRQPVEMSLNSRQSDGVTRLISAMNGGGPQLGWSQRSARTMPSFYCQLGLVSDPVTHVSVAINLREQD